MFQFLCDFNVKEINAPEILQIPINLWLIPSRAKDIISTLMINICIKGFIVGGTHDYIWVPFWEIFQNNKKMWAVFRIKCKILYRFFDVEVYKTLYSLSDFQFPGKIGFPISCSKCLCIFGNIYK